MRLKKQISAVVAAAMLAGALQIPAGFADEIVMEGDEFIPEEEIQIDDLGEESADVVTDDASGQTQTEGAVASDTDAALEEIPLIEDDGLEVVTVTDGADLTAVVTAESEADAAAEKIRELMDALPVELARADAGRIREYLEKLLVIADPTGSDGELEVGAYIEETMRGFGYTVSEQHFHEGFLNEDLVDLPGVNIIAERGANADMADRTRDIILVCAHYDSKANPQAGDPLANDKSGAAALLETARILSTVDSNVDLCFMFLSGEEDGYYGSLRLAEGLSGGIKERIRCVLYVGSVGYTWGTVPSREEAADAQTQAEDTSQAREEAAATDEAASAGEFLGEEQVYVLTGQESGLEAEDDAAADEAGETDEEQALPPYLVAVPGDAGNDPGELLRALGQYRAAQEMLAGDVLPQAEPADAGTEPDAEDWALLEAYETVLEEQAQRTAAEETGDEASESAAQADDNLTADAPQEAAVSSVVTAVQAAPVDETAAAMRLELLNRLADWRVVTGQVGSLESYTDNRMTVAQVLQPVDAAAAERARLRPVKETGETAEEADGQAPESISGALDAQPAADILLQAGAGEAAVEAASGETESTREQQLVPVLSTRETAAFADYLAAAVSLYMRSQTSLELDD